MPPTHHFSWFIHPAAFQAQFADWLQNSTPNASDIRFSGFDPQAITFEKYCQQRADSQFGLAFDRATGIAYMKIAGAIVGGCSAVDESVFGCYNTDRIHDNLDAAAQLPGLKALVIHFDTPGGVANGVAEAAAAIAAFASAVPVLAWCPMACSAGYWLASAGTAIAAPASGIVGSIGAYIALADLTGYWQNLGVQWKVLRDGDYKAMGHPGKPWTEKELAYLADQLAETSAAFKGFVQARRPAITAELMQGQALPASTAGALVDSTEYRTLTQFLQSLVAAAA